MTNIFVFGSNRAGRHGRGAARWAFRNRGAILGQGEGLQGESYALPTKDEDLNVLTLDQIKEHADRFLKFAEDHPDLTFELTPVGCGLAGYSHGQIAPLFSTAGPNIILPDEFRAVLGD
jgi:hypothetical protein